MDKLAIVAGLGLGLLGWLFYRQAKDTTGNEAGQVFYDNWAVDFNSATDSFDDFLLEGFDSMEPRGIRNKNPGNIEYTGVAWQGLDNPASDGRYCRFVSPEYGIRAITRILRTYRDKYGINTVAEIITRWAPATENDTGAYIAHVAADIGVAANQEINVDDYMPVLIKAIILHENGKQPYSDNTILDGIALA